MNIDMAIGISVLSSSTIELNQTSKQDGYIDRFFYILAYQIYAINIHDQTKLTLCLCSSDYLHLPISAAQTLGQALCGLHLSIFLVVNGVVIPTFLF